MSKKSRYPRARRDGYALFAAAYRAAQCAACARAFVVGEDKKLSLAYDPATLRLLSAAALCLACHRSLSEHMEEAHGIIDRDMGRVGS